MGGDLRRGKPLGLTPYGTEAMHILRAEKGYIIVGQDTDGTVTPQDAGARPGPSARTRPTIVGIRGLLRRDLVADGRKQLVGLKTSGSEGGAGRGRADRRRSEPAGADDDDRPCDIVLLVGKLRPLHRTGAG